MRKSVRGPQMKTNLTCSDQVFIWWSPFIFIVCLRSSFSLRVKICLFALDFTFISRCFLCIVLCATCVVWTMRVPSSVIVGWSYVLFSRRGSKGFKAKGVWFRPLLSNQRGFGSTHFNSKRAWCLTPCLNQSCGSFKMDLKELFKGGFKNEDETTKVWFKLI